MIERNTTIPAKKTQVFSTAADNQTAVTIRVIQGERQMADAEGNVELGRFDLIGIPPAPRGVPQVEVSFDIDANGIVHVSAKDKGTGKEQSIKISAPKKLSKEEIERMVKEAEKFAKEDEKRKEEVEQINQADNLIYQTEKALKDYGDKITPEERGAVEASVNELKNAVKDKNLERIKKEMEAVTKASHKLAEEVYKATSAKQGAGEGAQGPTPGAGAQGNDENCPGGDCGHDHGNSEKKDGPDDVIDADFKETK